MNTPAPNSSGVSPHWTYMRPPCGKYGAMLSSVSVRGELRPVRRAIGVDKLIFFKPRPFRHLARLPCRILNNIMYGIGTVHKSQ